MNRNSWNVWVCMVLAFLILVSCLPACKNQSPLDTDSGMITTGEDETLAERIKIVDAGKSDYVVVYSDGIASSVQDIISVFLDSMEETTGVRLESKSDLLSEGETHDPNAKEILIGKTNYAETATVLSTLMTDQYAVRQVGNKIVVTAHEDSYIVKAVTALISVLWLPLAETGPNGTTLYLKEYTLKTQKTGINGKGIEVFSIVYAFELSGYREVAEQLQTVIAESTGYTLPIYSDAERKEGSCEILIGNTNRAFSRSLYASEKQMLMKFQIQIKGDQVQILCGGPYSARECVSMMRSSFFGNQAKQFEDGTYLKTDLASVVSECPEGTDLRIMTSNILAARWGEDYGDNADHIPSVEQRAEIYAAVLAQYQPDVVGVQETDHKWVNYLPPYLDILQNEYSMEYTWLFPMWDDGKPNLTSILYRSDKLELLDSDREDFSYWNVSSYPYHLRVMAWGRFRIKTNPFSEFIVLNTHWATLTEESKMSAAETTAKVNALKAQGVPIFCTGDFNNAQGSVNIRNFLANTGMVETMQVAKANGTLSNYNGGYNTVGKPRSTETYVDHIMGYGNFLVLHYETILENQTMWLSDHSPQFTDIKFQ